MVVVYVSVVSQFTALMVVARFMADDETVVIFQYFFCNCYFVVAGLFLPS